jgi:hypothetical protein
VAALLDLGDEPLHRVCCRKHPVTLAAAGGAGPPAVTRAGWAAA